MEWGVKKVPKDFPLPIVDGAEVVNSARSTQKGKEVFMIMAAVKQTPAEVAKFYERELEEKDFEIKKMEHKIGEDQIVTLAGTKPGFTASITATRKAGKDKTSLMINWAPR